MDLDRVLTSTWIARRVRLCGVMQDEHLTRALGRGTRVGRSRLTVVVSGRLEASVAGRQYELGPGDFLLVPNVGDIQARGGNDETFELDWDDAASIASTGIGSVERGTLPAAAFEAARRLAATTHDGARALGDVLPEALGVLAAEGLPFDARGARHDVAEAPIDPDDQRLLDAVDDTFSNLAGGPAVIELEQKLGWSRRTVSRRTHALHARYGLTGLEGESWRSVRDFYRLLVGSILVTHPRMTTRLLATTLGYSSPEALCHAFANADLPSPGSFRKLP